jgi:hypothetical protein
VVDAEARHATSSRGAPQRRGSTEHPLVRVARRRVEAAVAGVERRSDQREHLVAAGADGPNRSWGISTLFNAMLGITLSAR